MFLQRQSLGPALRSAQADSCTWDISRPHCLHHPRGNDSPGDTVRIKGHSKAQSTALGRVPTGSWFLTALSSQPRAPAHPLCRQDVWDCGPCHLKTRFSASPLERGLENVAKAPGSEQSSPSSLENHRLACPESPPDRKVPGFPEVTGPSMTSPRSHRRFPAPPLFSRHGLTFHFLLKPISRRQ